MRPAFVLAQAFAVHCLRVTPSVPAPAVSGRSAWWPSSAATLRLTWHGISSVGAIVVAQGPRREVLSVEMLHVGTDSFGVVGWSSGADALALTD